MPPRRPVILSASRRTDLPGWHAQRLADRLDDQRARRGPAGIYGVVYWTRFPSALSQPPLRRYLAGPDAFPVSVVNLTVTGRGGTRLEPHAPATDDVLAALPELVALLGDPARLRWRFDPLFPYDDLSDTFARLADAFSRLAVPTCTLSFPAVRSLRGPLTRRYRELGVPQWPPPPSQAKADALARLADLADERGLQLLACSQPDTVALDPRRVQPAQCIPLDVLTAAHPPDAPAPRGKDSTQRRACRCPPSEDLGDYRQDACRTGCLYCYSTLGGPDAGQTVPWFLRGR